MPQHFIKIEIKGESDLPKEGNYWFHFKKSNFWGEDMQLWDVAKLISIHKNTAFIRSIDWYLTPEPQQPEQTESAESVTRSYPQKCHNCNGTGVDYKQISGMNTSAVCIVCKGVGLITVTETFAPQSHNNTVGPSEIEIARWAAGKVNDIDPDPDKYGYGDLLIMGAKYALSQCKAIDLKDELVKFRDQLKEESGAFITDEYIEYYIDNRQSE